MYIPAHFQQTDLGQLFDFIERHSFALLVSQLDGEPFATHLPLLLDRTQGEFGTLVGHLARANPHGRVTDGVSLCVFSGPHVYVTPAWYEAEHVVPTWNYQAVHAYGTIEWLDDHAATVEVVRDYVTTYERTRTQPWSVAAGDPYVDKLAQAVIAFRFRVTRLEGKWKLSQNQPHERRAKVIAALEHRPDENALAIAQAMREALSRG